MKRILMVLMLVLYGCSSPNEMKEIIESEDVILDNKEEVEEDIDEVCTIDLFSHAPVNMEKTEILLPLGLMIGSHVTPIDHHYFQNFMNDEYDIEIYSPGDGVITDVQHMPGAPDGEDYRVVIDHGCGISSIYIHLGIFSEEFRDLAPELQGKEYHRVEVEVKAGEVIGYYAKNVDYNVVDESGTLTGFVNPDSYKAESWKIHVPDTYEYFTEEIKNQLLDISIRKDEPIVGKIDYDIKGALVGNWFLEGTNGYAGDSTNMDGYWLGHLAIAYDAYDPSRIVFSIGGYNGTDSTQFGVKGNSPDPAEIRVEDGLIAYELVQYDYYELDGTHWNRISLVEGLYTEEYDSVLGTVLVQVIDDYTIHFESFVGLSAEDVYGFTESVKVYKR